MGHSSQVTVHETNECITSAKHSLAVRSKSRCMEVLQSRRHVSIQVFMQSVLIELGKPTKSFLAYYFTSALVDNLASRKLRLLGLTLICDLGEAFVIISVDFFPHCLPIVFMFEYSLVFVSFAVTIRPDDLFFQFFFAKNGFSRLGKSFLFFLSPAAVPP